jgi:hypothetical protein
VATGGFKLELAYLRDGDWHKCLVSRTTLANSRSIIELSERGVDVNSENGGKLVKFLSTLERVNMDRIPTVKRITHYGWIDDKHFAPGMADDYVLDPDGSGRTACLGTPKGSYELWKEFMNKHRKNSIFRFVMASCFAAPLLKPLAQRIYMVHNWGGSRGGKTAGQFCGLSVWGEPEKIAVNFNTTQVGLEKAAGFFCDLPLGINEGQLASGKQGFIENAVYMLAEGAGKLRGAKNGGLQEQTSWRCVIITNAEEPLTAEASQTGVSTRVLEVFGAPFPSEAVAKTAYPFVAKNHGHAGPEFIRHLAEYDKDKLVQVFERIQAELDKCAGHSGSHVASVAVSCTADYLADQWVFGADEKDAMRSALAMGKEILGALQTVEEMDVNEKAHKHIIDWIISNLDQFTDHYRISRLGFLERDEPDQDGKKKPIHHVQIIPNKLSEELKRAGYSYKKTMRWLVDTGKVEQHISGGRTRNTIRRRVDGIPSDLHRLAMPQSLELEGFTEVDDAELPF